MKVVKERLDKIIADLGLAENRTRAQALIMAGKVRVDNQVITKAGTQISQDLVDKIQVESVDNWASRGAHKLLKAFDAFKLDVNNKICVDIGASTGGFTDVLLANQAKKVYAVDVGYGQLIWRLASDKRVVVMDRTNARNLAPEDFDDNIDFVSCDASFISVKLILPVINKILSLDLGSEAVILIKPQFEAGRERLGRKGVVRDAKIHAEILGEVVDFIKAINNLFISGLTHSPILGPEGNIEFLCRLTRDDKNFELDIDKIVTAAHEELINN
ncbi:MAG: TlyA family RNA methyltransferase [Synergistaceae bacterium]|nr:TlyA family RNA methyltransferase [Synergistaceae bacterium]